MLENVEDVIDYRKPILDHLRRSFRQLGYVVALPLFETRKYGIPQSRKRVYIICLCYIKFGLSELQGQQVVDKMMDTTQVITETEPMSIDLLLLDANDPCVLARREFKNKNEGDLHEDPD